MLCSCVQTVSEIQTENNAQTSADTLNFTLSDANNIIFQAVLDERDTVNLFFDTGGTEVVLTYKGIRESTSLLSENASGEEDFDALEEAVHTLSLGNLDWDSLSVYPFPIGPEEAAGHFGWDLFEGKIVELNYDHNLMIIHDSLNRNLDDHTKLEMEFINTLFCVKATTVVGEEEYPNRYLFDTGFQRAVVLDKDLREKSKFPDDLPVLKESRLKNSAGEEFVNRVVKVDQICLGSACANEVPVQLLSTPNPARFETHILGNELLKRFNTILDFQNGFVYLRANSLMNQPYKDVP